MAVDVIHSSHKHGQALEKHARKKCGGKWYDMNDMVMTSKLIENELYEKLINNINFTSKMWDSVSLIFSESGTDLTGYRFFDGDWEGFGPKGFDWLKPAKALHKISTNEGKPWKKMLMSLSKEKETYTIEYEYVDDSRWKLGGKDLSSIEEFAYSLKRE